ncbi:uncharacterized protein LAJ45_02217 [Morchella importuna]|uniref:uncharacterized protein n=1 Tax=Morchella importuna TaxID=1174673 RepID=UPI001E8D5F68|nr:uncharacterized protein LAJ45_02217 [Morchella importuna]KAH8153405.1 hypothetical protein LAJ45_02217 [Morchella importuna]
MSEGSSRNDGGHRRTRSAMVSSLLHSSSSNSPSKSHSRNASAAVTPNSSTQYLTPANSSTASVPKRSISLRSPSSKPITEEPPPLPSTANTSATSLIGGSGVLVGNAKSVEDTVRTFRLYEALRNGDTMAISKTIREGSVDDAIRSSILQLAVQCAEVEVIEYILSTTTTDAATPSGLPYLDINHRDPTTGNTPLHTAAKLGRAEVVSLLLKQAEINDSIHNYNNRTPLEISRTPAVFQMLQLARSMFLEETIEKLTRLVAEQDYERIEKLLEIPRVKGLLDLNTLEPPTNGGGSTLLHDAARRRDTRLIEILLLHGADPFRRDNKGKLPQDVTKDDKTKNMLKKSPAAQAAARGIEERAVLGSAAEVAATGLATAGETFATGIAGKEGREMKGYLKKWTNYTSGYKLRWFVLEDGVLSYYKHQDDIGSACRGAINMRIAKLHMDAQDKQNFEIHGKGSVKYHLKANHVVEAKRWYWTLNNAIQWAKDEAREEERRKAGEAERMGRMREQQRHEDNDTASSRRGSVGGSSGDNRKTSLRTGSSFVAPTEGEESDFFEQSTGGPSRNRQSSRSRSGASGDEREGDVDDDDNSSNGHHEPPTSDALSLLGNSARLQLDLLSQVVLAVQFEHAKNPDLTLSDPLVTGALSSYESAVTSLKTLVEELLSMSKERDSYWRYRIEKEISLRKIWEENMAVLAREQETLESKAAGEREKKKKAKRALKEVLRGTSGSAPLSPRLDHSTSENLDGQLNSVELARVGSVLKSPVLVADSDSDSDDEDTDQFFDAIDSGEVEVVSEMPISVMSLKSPGLSERNMALGEGPEGDVTETEGALVLRHKKLVAVKTSFKGYEDPPRAKLSMDADDRPKISLWGILKSMIGKDMTKMTLPVSFNEPTSLLQRVAEDMEYTDLLDLAADRSDSTERMVYVAAFAASEYSSTIDRVAKPFNPLLGETYEYVRPDKNYRFMIEQVSHHPPIGAAWAEAEKWDYWGESAVRSKFYGKSFDINPLGTWFLRLRTPDGGEELYTWKKVTTSVIGIITGSPTVDNYGLMEIKNWTTGESCQLDFKARGWRVSTAYEVKGRVFNADAIQVWSIGGRWNDKIYARLSPGQDLAVAPPPANGGGGSNPAFLVWENHPRPPAPFNLTPFSITLNAIPDNLKPVLCPTDTRLRPDQRAMEEGEYDFAATEKNRLEEKQRAKRRDREQSGEEWKPRWFEKAVCEVTGEEYWKAKGDYWGMRHSGEWKDVDDIF